MIGKTPASASAATFADHALISRVLLKHDRNAFAELVRRHQSALRASLRKMTGGQFALADDIAQETFILAWKNIQSFRLKFSHLATFAPLKYKLYFFSNHKTLIFRR